MEASGKSVDHMATVSPLAPFTAKRRIRSDLEEHIPKPYLSRALVCPDTEHPKGTTPLTHPDMSVLQRHVAFFDYDNDGIIYPWDVYKGFRSLGFSPSVSFLSGIVVCLFFGYPTLPGWIPSPLLPVYVNNIHKCMHGSDTGAYDNQGRFVPAEFENMFCKYSHTVPDKFTFGELWNMTDSNGDLYDFAGRFMNKLEWVFLYLIAGDENGLVSKEDIRCLYDGTLFERIASMQRDNSK